MLHIADNLTLTGKQKGENNVATTRQQIRTPHNCEASMSRHLDVVVFVTADQVTDQRQGVDKGNEKDPCPDLIRKLWMEKVNNLGKVFRPVAAIQSTVRRRDRRS